MVAILQTRRDEIVRLRKAGEVPSAPSLRLFQERQQQQSEITDEDRARIAERFGAAAAAGRILRYTISTPGRKGDGIKLGRWRFERYRSNPIVLWSHNRWAPRVGDSVVWADDEESTDTVAHSLVAFYPRDLSELSWQVGEMHALRGGASSVSFRLTDWSWADEDENQDPAEEVGVWDINAREQELLEWSLVNVPMDADALVEARSAGIDTKPLAAALSEVLDRAGLRAELEQLWSIADPNRAQHFDTAPAPSTTERPPSPARAAADPALPAQLPCVGQDELRAALSGLEV